MSAEHTVTDEVKRILVEILDVELPTEDTDVLKTGRLDSLGLVEVIFAIEHELGVTVPLEELEIEHFRSARSIAAFLAGLDEGSPSRVGDGFSPRA